MLYQAYQLQSDWMSPFRLLAQSTSAALWLGQTEGSFLRKLSASMEVFSRMRLTHSRPAYNIDSVKVGEQEVPVIEDAVLILPFGTLLRFNKQASSDLPYQTPVRLVAALAATAIMAEDDDPAQPRSLTLMAGPVDCRVNPAGVNTLATSKPIEWFEKNLISRVPMPHAGQGRRVYPGFVQLSGFLTHEPGAAQKIISRHVPAPGRGRCRKGPGDPAVLR